MTIKAQISIRTRKLGVLIRDARLASRKSLAECGEVIGVSSRVFSSYEQGRNSPSLPELEVLAYFLELPIKHFWGKEAISDDSPPTEPLNVENLLKLRQRMIGAMYRKLRLESGTTLKEVSEQTGISTKRLSGFEMGEKPIPLPELEGLLAVFDTPVEEFFDRTSAIGKWMDQKRAIKEFLKLPADLQDFVCQPVNRPYIELARNLSEMPAEKLRAVAEGLLDITL